MKLNGISQQTGLPRFVIRIRANGSTYYYFRHGSLRERLPDVSDPQFAGTYAALLVAQGLASEAACKPARPRTFTPRKVYFVENERTGAIKIGVARWVKRRIHSLQIGSSEPLRLLGECIGEEHLERSLHCRFAHLKIRGEWFRGDSELRGYIQQTVG